MKHFSKVGSSLFSKTLQSAGISHQVEASRCVHAAQDVFKKEYGDDAHLHAQVISVKNRVLTVHIAHPAIAQHIREREETLISLINEAIGRPEIVRLQFSVRRGDDEVQ